MAGYLAWRETNSVFDELGVVHTSVPVNLDASEHPDRVDAQIFSWSLFHVLGVQPVLGRTFLPEEDQFGAPPVVVLSFGLWQRRFVGDPDVLGKKLPVDGEVSTIVGVMPPGFNFYNRNGELIP